MNLLPIKPESFVIFNGILEGLGVIWNGELLIGSCIFNALLIKRIWTIKRTVFIMRFQFWAFSMLINLVARPAITAIFSCKDFLSKIVSQASYIVVLLQVSENLVDHWVFLWPLNIFFHSFNHLRNLRKLRWSLGFSPNVRNEA